MLIIHVIIFAAVFFSAGFVCGAAWKRIGDNNAAYDEAVNRAGTTTKVALPDDDLMNDANFI